LTKTITKENLSSEKAGETLASLINEIKPKLDKIKNKESELKPSPDKWSQKEILGHLIDSAIINHQRFVRALMQDELVFPEYNQDEWVRFQKYNSSKWSDLVNHWYYLNLHLSGVMNSAPEEAVNRKRHAHNLNKIAWQTVPADQSTSLDYFMKDYIRHLEHHLNKLFKY
jgi:hypothetical protein